MTSLNDYILTLDIDWAPDFVIDSVAKILIEKNVQATWFVTHDSESIQKLRENSNLFELGIHPNMLNGSTHGKTEDEVLRYVKKIVPEAVSMRTHGLYQTSNFLTLAAKEYGILNDVSLFLPRTAYIQPHVIKWNGILLNRIPYFWEDDSEMFEKKPLWTLLDDSLKVQGIKVFDFHPIHIALNTDKFERYKKLANIQSLQSWDEDFIAANENKGKGVKDIFLELINLMTGNGMKIKNIITKSKKK